MKLEPAVKKETGYILLFSVLASVIMQGVFLLLHEWDITVIFGNLLGITAAVLNFFLMGITVQKAVKKKDEKEQRNFIKLSLTLRNFMILAFAVLGIVINVFNSWATIIPLFFPRIAIFLYPVFIKDSK